MAKFLEEEVFEYIKSHLTIGFDLVYGPSTFIDKRRIVCDASLFKGQFRMAVFEFCPISANLENIGDKQERLISLALTFNTPYAIFCDLQSAYVIDVYGYCDKGYIPDYVSLDEALKLLLAADDSEHQISDYHAEKLFYAIDPVIETSGLKDISVIEQLKRIDLEYIKAHSSEVPLFHSIYLDEDFEQRIFSILLKNKNDIKTVCRYTTLNTAFRIIDSKKNSLCSIVCMNDKSECFYVDKYLYNNAPEKLSEMRPARVKELNSNFIMSCSDIEMKDKLTMWRMYGDEAKGVCLEYDVDSDFNNHHFFMAPVSYAQSDGSHPELDFIKGLQQYPFKKFRLIFRTIDIWKYFFKPADYSSENEIRLLYVDKNTSGYKWIQTAEPILAPVIEFNIAKNALGYFPFRLKEIMLGPKAPERDTNSAQMAYRIELQQLKVSKGFRVTMSKIDNYR